MGGKKKKTTKREINFPELLLGGLIDLLVAVLAALITKWLS